MMRFRGVDTINTIHYAVFSVGQEYLFHALSSIFGGSILFLRCTTQYFRRIDTICMMHRYVFSGCGYYLYYVPRSIVRGSGYYFFTMHGEVFLGT